MTLRHAISGLILIAFLLWAGCATPPRHRKVSLKGIPTYTLERSDWDTSAKCMVYPPFGSSKHSALTAHLKQALQNAGYGVIEIAANLNSEKRSRVDKIVMLKWLKNRHCYYEGKKIYDFMAIFSVEDQRQLPTQDPNRRYFKVMARKKGNPPYKRLARNLLNLDSFRSSLQHGISK